MRIAYTTTFDSNEIHHWSGTPYFMSQNLIQQGFSVDRLGSFKRKLPPFFKLKQVWNKYIRAQRESPRFNVYAAKSYSDQLALRLKNHPADIILSPLINPIAYLETKKPIILWTDALYAGLLGFYPPFSAHSRFSIQQGNAMTQACLERVDLAIFSSEWAANSAYELYGADKNKIKVVPFGANLHSTPNLTEIKTFLKKRDSDVIKLLFLAKSWQRKGGDIVLAVADLLHHKGHRVELHIVGCMPKHIKLPPYCRYWGFISKHTDLGQKQLHRILAETHFLFVPSRAEAYGIVFCEANAFGIPCLTTHVGGINSIIKNNINGMSFSLHSKASDYADYILNTMHSFSNYEQLVLSSYQEYCNRLNWTSANQQVIKIIKEVI